MAKRKVKHAKQTNKSPGAKGKGGSKAKSIWGYEALPLLTMFIVPALAMFAIYHLFIVPLENANKSQQREYIIAGVNDQITQIVASLKQRVVTLAKSPEVVSVLADGLSPSNIEKSIVNFDYRVASARIVKRGQLRLNDQVMPPITYQSIDLVRRALVGEQVEPEMEGDFIRYASVVKGENAELPLGVIMLVFHRSVIAPALSGDFQEKAYFELRQSFDQNSGAIVWRHGDGALASNSAAKSVSLSTNRIWKLSAFQLEETERSRLTYAMAVFSGLISLICVLFMVLSMVLLARALKQDLSTLSNAIHALVRNKKPEKERFKISLVMQYYEITYDIVSRKLKSDIERGAASTSAKARVESKPEETDDGMGDFTNPLFETSSMVDDEDEDDEDEENPLESDMAISKSQNTEKKNPEKATVKKIKIRVPKEIFRAYDIRGIVGKTLSVETVLAIGKAIGTQALEEGQSSIVIARDGRLSGPSLVGALKEGLLSTGIDVIDIGMVPTPVLYFATHHFKTGSGVMLTGSHNPPSYNGLKIVINGTTLSGEQIQALRTRVEAGEFKDGRGSEKTEDGLQPYIDHILGDVVLARPLNVVIDCGNGVTGTLVPDFFEHLGCEVESLYADVDGQFPNHHPDPSNPKNLAALIKKVKAKGADLGIAFDGDGDRIGLVTNSGKIIYPDRLLMLFAKDLLARNPGADIIFDVKCSSDLSQLVSSLGGRPIMWKTGHSLIKSKLKETKAVIAGEMSGHVFFNDRWFGFDDAIYTAARLLEILSMEATSLDEIFSEFPEKVSTPELNIPVEESKKFKILEVLCEQGDFGNGRKTLIDGIRVDYENGWALVRASNTTPVLVTRFEAETEEAMNIMQTIFRDNLLAVDSDLEIPF